MLNLQFYNLALEKSDLRSRSPALRGKIQQSRLGKVWISHWSKCNCEMEQKSREAGAGWHAWRQKPWFRSKILSSAGLAWFHDILGAIGGRTLSQSIRSSPITVALPVLMVLYSRYSLTPSRGNRQCLRFVQISLCKGAARRLLRIGYGCYRLSKKN